jgi:hypothetical protein
MPTMILEERHSDLNFNQVRTVNNIHFLATVVSSIKC